METVSIATANPTFIFSEFDADNDRVEIIVKIDNRPFFLNVGTNRSNPSDIEIAANQAQLLALAAEMKVDAITLADELMNSENLQALVVAETAQAYDDSWEATILHKQGTSADFSTYEKNVHCVHDSSKYFFIADDSTLFVRTTISEFRSNSLPESVMIDEDEVLDRIESAIQDGTEDCNALFDELYAKAHAPVAA